jgi:hypothetical protein
LETHFKLEDYKRLFDWCEKAVKAHRAGCAALEQLDRPTEVLHRIVDFILRRTG